MSVTGVALILFLTFHGCMNVVALFSKDGYNMICELLGANWYAVAATLGLAALAVIHIVYAFILTMQNRRARGGERYAVTDKPSKVEWASQNMLVLGLIILLGLLLRANLSRSSPKDSVFSRLKTSWSILSWSQRAARHS